MNVYVKHWEPKDVEGQLNDIYGVRFGKHHHAFKYRAWYFDILIPSVGLLTITFTNSHKKFFDYWKNEWYTQSSWQLFK
jgi:hypothetical protein